MIEWSGTVNNTPQKNLGSFVESPRITGTTWNGSLPYFIFIAFIVIIMVITYKYIPETKGKSLEEIERFWEV